MTGDRQAAVFLTSRQQTSTTTLSWPTPRPDGARTCEFWATRRGWRNRPRADQCTATAVPWPPTGSPASSNLGLLEPPDDWLVRLPEEFSGRRIELATLSEAWAARTPVFVKPPSGKSFPVAVNADGSRLPRSGDSIGPDTSVLVSEVVTFTVEYRLFLLDRRIATASRYAVHGRLDTAPLRCDSHEREVRVHRTAAGRHGRGSARRGRSRRRAPPRPDTGREGWAAVEASMPWSANSYAADPDQVLDVVLSATGPYQQFSDRDRPFLCPAPMRDSPRKEGARWR